MLDKRMLWLVVAVAVSVVALLAFQYLQSLPVAHIRGPVRFPVLGSIPFLLKRPWETFSRWSNEQGPVYKVFIWGTWGLARVGPVCVRSSCGY